MLRRRAVLLVMLGAVAPAGQAHASDKVFRAQLDGDAPLEQLRTQVRRCGQPFPCSRLVLRDGRRRIVLTPFRQKRRFLNGWEVRRLRLVDFTGDGIKEIAYELHTAGGTASSPARFAVARWDGTKASGIFRFESGRQRPEPGYEYSLLLKTTIIRPAGGLTEIETKDGLYHADDGTCCPSAVRTMRWRWDGTRIALVPGSKRIDET
jgi:hypothetical protein